MLWFRIPEKLYFKRGCFSIALDELKNVYNKKKALIVTDAYTYKNGLSAPIEKKLDLLNIQHTVFFDIADDSLEKINSGVRAALLYEPDVIIAAGGSEAINAAKLIRFLYENPNTDVESLSSDFSDIRTRSSLFPKTNIKAMLAAVPVCSAAGDEVSPYVCFKNDGKMIRLADYELMPEFTVVDPELMTYQSKEQIAKGAASSMMHLFDAYGSDAATEYTDGMVIKSLQNYLAYLPSYLEGCSADPTGCEKIAEASTMSGIAWANTGYVCHEEKSSTALRDTLCKAVGEKSDLRDKYLSLASELGISGNNDSEKVNAFIEKVFSLARLCD